MNREVFFGLLCIYMLGGYSSTTLSAKALTEQTAFKNDIALFEKITGGKKENTYITIPAKSETLKKSFANIPTVKIDEVRNINPVDLLSHKYIIISYPTESFAFLGGKMEKKVVGSK